jgi:hypothetical protein
VDARRFRDPFLWPLSFAAENIDVVCPRCGSHAVVATERVEGCPVGRWPRRLVCTTCVTSTPWTGNVLDPSFIRRLWFRAGCCGGHTLWAYNETHLELLENYVAATLRERGDAGNRMTVIARLPAWLKAARNRDEILRTITRLRASAPAAERPTTGQPAGTRAPH